MIEVFSEIAERVFRLSTFYESGRKAGKQLTLYRTNFILNFHPRGTHDGQMKLSEVADVSFIALGRWNAPHGILYAYYLLKRYSEYKHSRWNETR